MLTHLSYPVTSCSSSKLYVKQNSAAFFFTKSLKISTIVKNVLQIPFFKRIGLREVAGAGFLYAPERNNLVYAEVSAGVERVFKFPFNQLGKFKIGFYVVGSAANQFRNPVQFKIGFTTWDRKRGKWF